MFDSLILNSSAEVGGHCNIHREGEVARMATGNELDKRTLLGLNAFISSNRYQLQHQGEAQASFFVKISLRRPHALMVEMVLSFLKYTICQFFRRI